MTRRIIQIRTNMEAYAAYRFFKRVHDWTVEKLDVCRAFPLVLGMLMWPSIAIISYKMGLFVFGLIATLFTIAYWLHIILFED